MGSQWVIPKTRNEHLAASVVTNLGGVSVRPFVTSKGWSQADKKKQPRLLK